MRVADLLRQCLTGEVRQSMAEAVCERPAQIHRAADAAAGLLVAAMAHLAEQPEGARALLARLREDDPVPLANLHETTRGSQANMLMERGGEQILQLFGGDFYEAAGRAISGYGGLGLGASRSILCLMMPIALTAVHRTSSSRASLDALTLSDVMAQQTESTAELMPDGFWAVARSEPRLRPIADYLRCQPDDSADLAMAPSSSVVGSFLSRFMPWAF
jgi:hypothetical protein